MTYDVAFFIALLATAIAFGGALAHALELPNKMHMPQADYFTVQQVYRGWNRIAFVLAVQLFSLIGTAVFARREPYVLAGAVLAIVCLLCAQAVFWIFTFPANVATANWTTVPDNWESLRNSWEYSHLAGAAFQLIAMSALAFAALARARS